ncbi:MAG: alpha/beta fold hydrolase [Solirubrobacterales bacterium]
MRRWVKVSLAVVAGIAVLLALNAITISNETQDAERTVEGAELMDTAKGEVQVLEEGDPAGEPIVLIHCYACSMRWFDEVAALLAADHRVIRTDLLGHGGSAKPSGGYSIPDQAAAIAEVLGALNVRDATIVGHSLGGTIAAAVAEQSPDVAARVVNIDQAADDSFEDLSFLAELGYKPVVGQALKRFSDIAPSSVVRAEYEQAFAPGYNIASGFEDPDQVVEDFGEMTYTAYEEAAEAEGDFTDVRPLDDRLSALSIPVMVIFGTEDQIYDTDAAVQRFEDIEDVRVELIEGAGHSPNVEVPDRVAALIAAFAAEPTPAEIAAAERKRAAAKRKAAAAKRKAAAAKRKAAAQKGAAKAGKTGKPAQ